MDPGQAGRPLVAGLTSAIAAQTKRAHGEVLDRTEQDIPIKIVGLLSVAALVGIAVLLAVFAQGTALAGSTPCWSSAASSMSWSSVSPWPPSAATWPV